MLTSCRLDNEALSLSSPHRQLHWAYLVAVNARLLLFPSPLLHDYRMNAIPLLQSLSDPRHLITLITMMTLFLLCQYALSKHLCTRNVTCAISRNTDSLFNNRQHCRNNDSQDLSFSSNQNSTISQGPPANSSLITGLLLLIIPFLPASNLFFPVGFVVAERILYLPSMGSCLLVAHSIYRMVKSKHKIFSTGAKLFFFLLLVTHSTKTMLRNRDWESKLSLYASVLREYPTNGHILANIAQELRSLQDYERAEQTYRYSIHVAPDVVVSYVNLGSMLHAQSRLREAEQVK